MNDFYCFIIYWRASRIWSTQVAVVSLPHSRAQRTSEDTLRPRPAPSAPTDPGAHTAEPVLKRSTSNVKIRLSARTWISCINKTISSERNRGKSIAPPSQEYVDVVLVVHSNDLVKSCDMELSILYWKCNVYCIQSWSKRRRLFSLTKDGQLRFWDVKQGINEGPWEIPTYFSQVVFRIFALLQAKQFRPTNGTCLGTLLIAYFPVPLYTLSLHDRSRLLIFLPNSCMLNGAVSLRAENSSFERGDSSGVSFISTLAISGHHSQVVLYLALMIRKR